MSGSTANYGTAQRRSRTIQPVGVEAQLRDVQRRLQTKRIVSVEKLVGSGVRRLEEIERLFSGDQATQGEILFSLAQEEIGSGRFGEAELLLRRLVTKHGGHELVDAALLWLVNRHSSLETSWREHRGTPSTMRHDRNVRMASATEPVEEPETSDRHDSVQGDPIEADYALAPRPMSPTGRRGSSWPASLKRSGQICTATPSFCFRSPRF